MFNENISNKRGIIMSNLSILGHSEEEVLTCICRSAARYMTGNTRPIEELQTEVQQKQAVEMERAVYAYLHDVASEKGWDGLK